MTTDTITERLTVTSPDGTPIGVWCSGTGRPLVLVHGTTADHNRWEPVRAGLAEHARVCAVDRRGRGASGDAEPYAIEREYEDVAAVVAALADRHGGPIDLFGHSYGAICSLEAAADTDNVRRLVLYEPPVLFDREGFAPDLLDRLDALVAEGQRDEAVATFFRDVVGVPDEQLALMRTLPAWAARVDAAHTVAREERGGFEYRFDAERFASVTVPTLLLDGDQSPPFLRDSTRAVAAALPLARVAVLEGQQHVAIDTVPDVVIETVIEFLDVPS